MDKINELKEILKNTKHLVFFGGAGTSTDSGIKDFRGKNGLYKTSYKGYAPEEILSIDFFNKNRDIFLEYIDEQMSIEGVKPNKGHYALVKLEKLGILKSIITQNIDNLHQEAGNSNVLELHGTLKEWYCLKCGKRSVHHFKCDCEGVVRPKVTLYGEMLDGKVTQKAIDEIENADTLIIAGTSLTVYPAAAYIGYFRGKNLVIINDGETQYDNRATLVINDNFANIMDEVVQNL
ncbi:NAD-dependent protein deacylase [Fusobacterium sp. PH5-44]|uniref:NAD-dependent protein deacylase n=1 Tax=unclassified Fusobacterium TaxID=2648384 RepID=UPI003D1CFCAF